jgi:hypothetical protein
MKMNLKKEDNTIKIMIIGLLIVLAIAVFPITQKESTTVSGNDKTIIVSGDSQKTVMPDIAKVYIKIETVNDTADVSQSENARITNDVRTALLKIVDEEDLETSQYYLNEKYEWDADYRKSEVVGYITMHILEIKTDDVKNIGELIDVAVAAGANGVNNVNFELSDKLEKELREELLGVAAKEAKSKAESLSDALGVKLVGVKSVSESNFYANPYIYRGMTASMDAAESVKVDTEISPQSIDVTASVSVIYSIE